MGAQGSHNFNIIPPIPEGTALLIFLVHSNLKEIPRGLFFFAFHLLTVICQQERCVLILHL